MSVIASIVQSVFQPVVQRVDGAPSVLSEAYGAWGTYDFYGTGNAVVRLRNSASSPTERDFTATELTDGTYTSWYSSGQTYVSKMYDQKGSNDLYHASTSLHPKYDSSDNTVQQYQPSQYTRSYLWCDNSVDIANTFDGNSSVDSVTTLVMSAKKPSGSVGFTDYPAFGIMEGFAPTAFINKGHRFMITGGGSFNTKMGVSMRTEYPPSVTTFEQFQSDFSSSFKTYHALFNRVASGGGIVTALDLYQDGTQTIDSTTTTLGTTINQDRFLFGDNSGIKANALFVFNKEFDSNQIDSIHTELSANY
jgi:hypothetical protein